MLPLMLTKPARSRSKEKKLNDVWQVKGLPYWTFIFVYYLFYHVASTQTHTDTMNTHFNLHSLSTILVKYKRYVGERYWYGLMTKYFPSLSLSFSLLSDQMDVSSYHWRGSLTCQCDVNCGGTNRYFKRMIWYLSSHQRTPLNLGFLFVSRSLKWNEMKDCCVFVVVQ